MRRDLHSFERRRRSSLTIIVFADARDPRVDGFAVAVDLDGDLAEHKVDEVAVLEAADELRAVEPLRVVLLGAQDLRVADGEVGS